MTCPKCGSSDTKALAGGFIRCLDCERREIQRTAMMDAARLATPNQAIRPALREALDV